MYYLLCKCALLWTLYVFVHRKSVLSSSVEFQNQICYRYNADQIESPRGLNSTKALFLQTRGSKTTLKSPYSEKQNFFLKIPPQKRHQISVTMEGTFLKNRGTKTPLFSAYGEETYFLKKFCKTPHQNALHFSVDTEREFFRDF